MKSEWAIWASTALFAVAVGIFLATGASGASVLVLAVLGLGAFTALGMAMRRPADATWLARWVALGFVAKIGGTLARYWILQVIYDGTGDSVRYYRVGQQLAVVWNSGSIPGLTGEGGVGTQVTEAVTGALFAIFTPDQLGGFVMFALIAYAGQLGLYAAYRRWAPAHALKPYALAILFLPTYAFWPSSIGKDALILFGLGLAAYCAARALEGYEVRWLWALAGALGVVGAIRIHIAALFVGALLVTSVVAKRPASAPAGAGFRRMVVIAVLGAGSIVAASLVPDLLGFEGSSVEEVTAFADDVLRRTTERGTIASGEPVDGIEDIPGAVSLVLFRPYVFEATELQHLMAAAETTLLAGVTLFLAPRVIRNWRSWRANAYVVFASVYTIGFAVGFSAIRNLGIIARQRGQVLAFFLAVILILGWHERRKRSHADRSLGDGSAPTAVAPARQRP